jgi:hypothetical protein
MFSEGNGARSLGLVFALRLLGLNQRRFFPPKPCPIPLSRERALSLHVLDTHYELKSIDFKGMLSWPIPLSETAAASRCQCG